VLARLFLRLDVARFAVTSELDVTVVPGRKTVEPAEPEGVRVAMLSSEGSS